MKYKGIFFDDDERNFETIRRKLKDYDIYLAPYAMLPEKVEDTYIQVMKENVDFVIIDFDLGKQPINYNGIDIMKAIREQDKEIYMIYLTNKDFDDADLGEFDQAVKKVNFNFNPELFIGRMLRQLSRELSVKNERELENSLKMQKGYYDKELDILIQRLEGD